MDLRRSQNAKIFMEKIGNAIVGGKNTVDNFMQYENISIDLEWISQIETYIFSVEKVVKKPKKFIKDESLVVPVERANRVDARTIRHLATHTGNIRDIDEQGFVTPNKVLTTQFDEDVAIYENRFVYTLINNLSSFVENRYSIITKNTASKTHLFKQKSLFNVGASVVEYNLDLKIADNGVGEFDDESKIVLNRIAVLRKRIMILKSSEFYQQLSKTKPLYPPIIKTNILNLEIDYNNCYKLWLYLATYTKVGYSISVSDKLLNFEDKYFDDLTLIVGYSLLAVLRNGKENIEKIESTLPPKKFNVERKIDYSNVSGSEISSTPELDFSQYYFDAIKQVVSDVDFKQNSVDKVEHKLLDMPFIEFYKRIASVNDKLCKEALDIRSNTMEIDCDDPIEKKSIALANLTAETKKYEIILKQKRADTKAFGNVVRNLKSKQKRLKESIVKLKQKQKEMAKLAEKPKAVKKSKAKESTADTKIVTKVKKTKKTEAVVKAEKEVKDEKV